MTYWSDRIEVDSNGCWNWTGCLNNCGYGMSSGGRSAHKRSYIEHVGPVPTGLVVRHLCANKRCCNPAHLAVGTQSQNRLDIPKSQRSASAKSAKRSNPNHFSDMGKKGGGHNEHSADFVQERLDQISHLNPNEWGYINKVAEVWRVSHTTVRRFLNKHST